MTRILLISGSVLTREESLRRRILRFTGSRRATRLILENIRGAQRAGRIMSCMVVPERRTATHAEPSWQVRVSFIHP